jgi:hypothetical protein
MTEACQYHSPHRLFKHRAAPRTGLLFHRSLGLSGCKRGNAQSEAALGRRRACCHGLAPRRYHDIIYPRICLAFDNSFSLLLEGLPLCLPLQMTPTASISTNLQTWLRTLLRPQPDALANVTERLKEHRARTSVKERGHTSRIWFSAEHWSYFSVG